MLQITVYTAYIFSVISFGMFVYAYFSSRQSSSDSTTQQSLGDAQPHGAVADMAKLIEALAKLTDSFSKGGRVTTLLVSSIFFLLVAAAGSGLDAVANAINT